MSFASGERVHFVGIGGAGMSAIAKVLIENGVPVSGSDLKRSRAMAILDAIGATVHVGHDADFVEGAERVVVSTAIPPHNPELERARELGLPVMSRGEALAEVLEDLRTIVVAGTHGKTTTTSMIASVLLTAGREPTYLIGGGLNDAGTNARSGRGEIAVAESDESDGSFLKLTPWIAVVTNLEVDHVDYWESFGALTEAFATFLGRVPDGGTIVVPANVEFLETPGRVEGRRTIEFGEDGSVAATEVVPVPGGTRFKLVVEGEAGEVSLRVPGAHNVSNALAAAAACSAAGLDVNEIATGLGRYMGVERRFELKGTARGVTVIDDYAHHPTEVKATLAAARTGDWPRIVAVFQPHRYSRTAAFAPEFGASFDDADRIVLTDVYGAGEAPVPGVTGKRIVDEVASRLPGRPLAYFPHRDEILEYLAAVLRPGDAVLTLGAGDVTTLGDELLRRLEAGERA